MDVPCSSMIQVGATNYPAAIMNIDPPSMIAAATTIVVATVSTVPGWQEAAAGGYVKPDGSQVGAICAKADMSVQFLVPAH